MNWLLLKNSLVVAGSATLAAAGFGFISALFLASLPAWARRLCLGLAMVALTLPPFLVTNCWLHLLGRAGVWRGWLPLDIVSLGGTVWILSLMLWPISLFCVWSGWRRLEPAQIESDPSVAGWALIRGLLWPMAHPALAPAAVVTFVLALNNFAVPAILQVKVFPAELWIRLSAQLDAAGALALSWPLVVAPLLLLCWLSQRGVAWPHLEMPVSARLFRQQLGPFWVWASGMATGIILFLAALLPLTGILTERRTWTELPGAVAANQGAIGNSFWFAASSALIVLAVALVAGAFRAPGRRTGPAGRIAATLVWLPFLVPGVLLGLGWIYLLDRPWTSLFYSSPAMVILAFSLKHLAIGWATVSQALRAVDPDLVDAARLEGATRWQLLCRVEWPQIAPRALAAWYVVFLLSLWEVESLILIVPPGCQTLGLNIFNLLHYGHNAQVNALCLTLLALAVLPALVFRLRPWLRRPRLKLAGATALAALLVNGCAPDSPGVAPIQSGLFSGVRVIGARGAGVGQFNKPRSAAVDGQDNLYVVDMTGRVQKFSPDGVTLLSWQMPQTDLGKAKGMCRDAAGNIVVVEPHYSRMNHYSPAGELVARWGERGTNDGQFWLPRAAAVNSRNEIVVSEYQGAERVQRFALPPPGSPASARPRWLASFGRAGTGPGQFNRPEGLCVDAANRIYVADSCNHRIQIFTGEGEFLRAYGRPGQGKGELSYPYDICVDAAGRQYVCEFGNSRIQVFDAADQPIEVIGGPGAEPGRFNNPWGLALDSQGNLYVADSQNHRVQKLIRTASRAKAGPS